MALGPFGPGSDSKLTRAPSASDLKPWPLIALWWTKRSLPPSSGAMKPKPLSSLNHLTVPVAMSRCPPRLCALRPRRCNRANDCGRFCTPLPGSLARPYGRKVAATAALLRVGGEARGGELAGQRARRPRIALQPERTDRVVALVVDGHAHAVVRAH